MASRIRFIPGKKFNSNSIKIIPQKLKYQKYVATSIQKVVGDFTAGFFTYHLKHLHFQIPGRRACGNFTLVWINNTCYWPGRDYFLGSGRQTRKRRYVSFMGYTHFCTWVINSV
jgi:hypothetical protein